MRRIISSIILVAYLLSSFFPTGVFAVTTNGMASPWTRDKAVHLARAVLFDANQSVIDALSQAGSAEAAVNILFPDASGPDRTAYENFMSTYASTNFNWDNSTHTAQYYQLQYALDPYEAKRKLFSLYEDIFSVGTDQGKTLGFRDIQDMHDLLYRHMLGNYQTLVKRVLYNNGEKGDFAEGMYLDLFNRDDPKNPNQNYARELLQLFLMGEYKPLESRENNNTRNYEESDVASLSKLLTGLRSDTAHVITLDTTKHYTEKSLAFLTGTLTGNVPAYYNTASGTIDPVALLTPTNGNNGLTDNVIEYIFAKRSHEIALFLADRLYRFYIHDTPDRGELDQIAAIIEGNNFEMLPSVKSILSHNIMYSEKSMRSIRYKNPLELSIGTVKKLQNNDFNKMSRDPNILDTGLLRQIGWVPYSPGSVFGRDGFDDSMKWMSNTTANAWITATNNFLYRMGTGSVDFLPVIGSGTSQTLSGTNIAIRSDNGQILTGNMIMVSGVLEIGVSSRGTAIASTRDIPVLSAASSEPVIDTGSALTVIHTTGNTGTTGDSPSSGTGEKVQTGVTLSIESTGSLGDSGSVIQSSTGSFSLIDSGSVTDTGITLALTGNTGSGGTGTIGNPLALGTGVEITPSTVEGASGSQLSLASTAATTSTITLTSGSVNFPRFTLTTNTGELSITSGSYDASRKVLTISSGSLYQSGVSLPVSSGTIQFTTDSFLREEGMSAQYITTRMSQYLLGDIPLPGSVITALNQFLVTDASGASISINLNDQNYIKKKILGLASIILSQPEYLLPHGSDMSPVSSDESGHFLDNVAGKIVFVELYGGNDGLASFVQKDEYDTYVNYRTNSSGGTIAIPRERLVDIGDFYMHPNLAYGSGGTPGFKSLYDEGSLKIFHRVGAARHTQDHDAAAKLMSSYGNTTAASAVGLFGKLVEREYESANTIALGAKAPGVFRGGRYMNIGSNIIIRNALQPQYTEHIDALMNIAHDRTYPSDTRNIFLGATRINEIGKLSVARGGTNGTSGNVTGTLGFMKTLMENNIGKSYYVSGYGGYDSHGDQIRYLETNYNVLSTSLTSFFNQVKDTQNVTIVIFSEFGRTSRVNASLGTDHGDGGAMMVITSSPALKSLLQNGTYGNLSIKNAKANTVGVGIDYRSIYAKIFQALYGLDGKTYFNDQNISLENDISTVQNEISLLSYRYQVSGQNVYLNGEFFVNGANYNIQKAGYTRVRAGTGANNYTNNVDLSQTLSPQGYRYTFQIPANNNPYFQIESFSNQYALTSVSGSVTGTTLPRVIPNPVRSISQTENSILAVFNGVAVPSRFTNTGIILEGIGGNTITPTNNPDIAVRFGSGLTQVTSLTSSSGTLTWQGGFILGDIIDPNTFLPKNAVITGENTTLQKNQIRRLVKIGADRLGVGMVLNQPVTLILKNITRAEPYRIVSSEDGVSWTDVESLGKQYQKDANGEISFPATHFSYFALIAPPSGESPPSCSISVTPTSVTNGSGAVLSWNLINTQTGIITPSNTIVSLTGTMNVTPPPSTTTTYSISVTNTIGSATCSTQVIAYNPNSNTGSTNTGSTNTGSTNTGSTNTGSTNTGSTNTGSTNTGSTNTGSTNTGSSTNTNGNTTGIIVQMTGPGGVMPSIDFCPQGDTSGSPYDGRCMSIIRSSGTILTPSLPSTSQNLLDIQNFITDIIDNQGDIGNTLTRRDSQLLTQASLLIWRKIVLTPSLREELYQGVIEFIQQKSRETSDPKKRQALTILQGRLQTLHNNPQSTNTGMSNNMPNIPESQTVYGDGSLYEYLYVNAPHSLRIRSSAGILRNNIIGYLMRNERIKVLEENGGWTKILWNDITGYVKGSYLRKEISADLIRSGVVPENQGTQGVVTVGQANMRKGGDMKYSPVATLSKGSAVTVLDEVNGWLEIMWNNTRGWIRHNLIQW